MDYRSMNQDWKITLKQAAKDLRQTEIVAAISEYEDNTSRRIRPIILALQRSNQKQAVFKRTIEHHVRTPNLSDKMFKHFYQPFLSYSDMPHLEELLIWTAFSELERSNSILEMTAEVINSRSEKGEETNPADVAGILERFLPMLIANNIFTYADAYNSPEVREALINARPFTYNHLITSLNHLIAEASSELVYTLCMDATNQGLDKPSVGCLEILSAFENPTRDAFTTFGKLFNVNALLNWADPLYEQGEYDEYSRRTSDFIALASCTAFWTKDIKFALKFSNAMSKGKINQETAELIAFTSYFMRGGNAMNLIFQRLIQEPEHYAGLKETMDTTELKMMSTIQGIDFKIRLRRDGATPIPRYLPVDWERSSPKIGIFTPDY